jgi:hypothetical protein
MKYKTQLVSKATLLQPQTDKYKSVASSLKGKYGFDLKPQMDLLYLESCLVSAGVRVGVNDNDDIFTREECWAARQTPVLKPFNWQHQDKDIVGVIYTVQARDLNGNVLDIDSETVPDTDFDLWTEAVIFRLIHPDRAREVEARSKTNDLFVSMEAWFDDYSYGLYGSNGLAKIVARNEKTAFLDKHLRAAGGVGKYHDPESGQDMRIGRVLHSITFGGCGLVDHPANKRSVITTVDVVPNTSEQDEIELFLQKVMESEARPSQELAVMNTQANVKPDEIKTAIESVLDSREQAAAKAAAEQALQARAATAEAMSKELEAKNAELNKALEVKNQEVKSLNDQTAAYDAAVKKLIEEHVTAGATNDVPPEIAKIDAAKTGEEAFKAKIAWIQNSLASLRTRAARAAELEAKLAEAEMVVREQDVRSLLGDVMSEEAVETFVAHAATLDAETYSHWRDEKELMVIEMAKAAKKAMDEETDPNEAEPDADEDDAPFKKGKKNMKKDAKASNPFAALLAKYRSESQADADTSKVTNGDPLINHPGGEGIKSGVNPGQLKTPRHKIAGGAAGNDPLKVLETAKPKNGVSLAGASQAGGEGESVNPFRVLAGLVTDSTQESEDSETKPEAKKPGFDPVQ